MANEHEGVSPASAGGAPAPDPIGTIRDVVGTPFVLCDKGESGRRWVPVVGAGGFVDGDFWRVGTRPVIGAVPGTPAASDRRDAEIEQLRTALARYQKRLGDDLLCGGKLVERVRAALRVDNGGTCTRASMDGVVGDVGRLCAEIERLRQQLTDALAENARVDEYHTEWQRADAEVTRLRKELDGIRRFALMELGVPATVVTERNTKRLLTDLVVKLEQKADALTEKLDQHLADENSAQAANDRLRDEIEQLRPTFRPGQRVRIGKSHGFVSQPRDITWVRLEGMAVAHEFATNFVHAVEDDTEDGA